MPQATSKRQWRMMMAILHEGNKNKTARGDSGPPASIAGKYSKPGKGVEEDKGKAGPGKGGTWSDKKKKKKIKKAFEQFYRGQGAGVIVLDNKGRILVGECTESGQLTTPGGHVDPGEDYMEAAHRETREEAGIVCGELHELGMMRSQMNDSKCFVCTDFKGKPKNSNEVKNWKWIEPHLLADEIRLRGCCKEGLNLYLNSQHNMLKKSSLKHLIAVEKLQKNVLRGPDGRDAVFDVSHGDALRLVGNGAFRMLRDAVIGMNDEDFKEVKIDGYTLNIRKHLNDIYSGRVYDGQKLVHQFSHKSLPALTADLMSVFEWYLPEDNMDLELLTDDHLSDDAISGGINELVDNYKRHNLANIYDEMETMRVEIRSGNAVDIQQVEARLMTLFDKIEKLNHDMAEQHNKLCDMASNEINTIEAKLRELQSKVDSMNQGPKTVEAYSASPVNPDKVYNNEYFYLPKPQITIEPNGRIKIVFGEEWNNHDKGNFLNDMRARVIKK